MGENRFLIALLIVLCPFLNSTVNGEVIPFDSVDKKDAVKIYDETGCLFTSYEGLVMCGYQGWFTAEGDGAGRGWHHYEKHGQFKPGVSTIDFWPDVREYKVTYETAFQYPNGEKAHVYSPYDEESVDLHFKWMKEYGIDGVFMQRFVSEIKGSKGKNHFNKVLENALKAAKKYQRAISIMYDLSGCQPEDLNFVYRDWKELQETFDLFNNKVHPSYLRHNGKPLVAVWGVGFNDNRKYTVEDAQKLVTNLKTDSNPSSILLGVPYYWRYLKGDTENSPLLHPLIADVDIILPWAVGRYNNKTYEKASSIITEDIAKCNDMGVDYVPLVFPGFSWGNLKNTPDQYNQIPREKGDFLWHQIATAKIAGAKMLYVAMFDEVDEGTAIFKCLKEDNLPLNGDLRFVGIEKELENDHYLWLTGQGANWFHGEGSYGNVQPSRQ
ncbi:MAG TPA: glycoside hydrolase family 71/99-like protein [Prolixibacteraceae bacterium]|nr:glycoside hydrolase family 71/99-like protein [Prolixibacteraceae bacterium]